MEKRKQGKIEQIELGDTKILGLDVSTKTI